MGITAGMLAAAIPSTWYSQAPPETPSWCFYQEDGRRTYDHDNVSPIIVFIFLVSATSAKSFNFLIQHRKERTNIFERVRVRFSERGWVPQDIVPSNHRRSHRKYSGPSFTRSFYQYTVY